MCQVLEFVKRLAVSEVRTVLLQGETGVGKDVIANILHQNSRRSGMRFVAMNCAAIPETLFESELFGYERGAFTDARTSKPGLLEVSNHGTMFLDEIGQLPHWMQGKLLRVLEGGSFRRVGGLTDLQIDLRFVAASNEDLVGSRESRCLSQGPVLPPQRLPDRRFRRCASGARTFCRWPNISSVSTTAASNAKSRASRRTPPPHC